MSSQIARKAELLPQCVRLTQTLDRILDNRASEGLDLGQELAGAAQASHSQPEAICIQMPKQVRKVPLGAACFEAVREVKNGDPIQWCTLSTFAITSRRWFVHHESLLHLRRTFTANLA